MTAQVPDAGWLAPIVARLDRLESAVTLIVETASRLGSDTARLEEDIHGVQVELQEVQALVRGRS